jgi:hypothetical protein
MKCSDLPPRVQQVSTVCEAHHERHKYYCEINRCAQSDPRARLWLIVLPVQRWIVNFDVLLVYIRMLMRVLFERASVGFFHLFTLASKQEYTYDHID